MTTKPDDLQRLLAEEPFVRALAHSLVADEADDVVQQAFLQALEHRPADLVQPRGWLARVVRNLVADQRRRRDRADARHRSGLGADRVPSSSDLLEGEERRRSLVAAVDRLPADQRTVVLLRYYDGLPPRRIAAELGLPVTTVSNRLHDALQTLRVRLDAEHGDDRRAWLLPLVPFATLPRALPWREVALTSSTPALVMGVIAMTTKTKIVTAVAALLVLALAWVAWPRSDNPGTWPPDRIASNAGSAAQGDLLRASNTDVPAAAPRREAVAASPPATATNGVLVVHVRYADEPTVAAGLTVLVSRPGGDFRVGLHRAVTDEQGTARFEGLPPGRMRASTTIRAGTSVKAEIEAGATCECTLQLRGGMTLTGIVVDAAGVPVGGATIESGLAGISGVDADQIATTAADGTFVVRECGTSCVVGARAAGHAASPLHFLGGKPGAEEHVRIELRTAGGAVEGVVVGPAGEPVAAAVVRIGTGNTTAIMPTPQGAPPLPAQVRTDATGRFVAIGVPAGTQPVGVRAAGLAPWLGTCEVTAGSMVALRIVMSPGVTCHGIVRAEDGQPAPDVDVSVGDRRDFVLLQTRSAADGTFTLTGLPTGEFVLAAGKDRLGEATARLRGQPGETLRCELQLSNGLALRGRVLDDVGTPVAGADIVCEIDNNQTQWAKYASTDGDGRFLVPDCPSGQRLTVRLSAREHLPLQQTGIDPLAGELELRLARDTAPKARISGRLLRPDGRAATGETVAASRYQPQLHKGALVKDDGSFSIEVPSGEWYLGVEVRNHPEILVGPQSLEPGATWEIGTLQLVIGGTLVVHDRGEPQLHYLVFDTRDHFLCGLHTPAPPLRSELLVPGDYVLLARGPGIAAQVLPFTIRAAQETDFEIQRPTGVRQRLEFVPAAGGELPPRSVAFAIRRDGKLILWDRAEGDPLTHEIWLAPGSYSLATRDWEPQRTASFTVGSTEGPPVRVTLR